MLDRIRRLLTLGYVGILALILVLFGAIVTLVFSNQLSRQQDAQLVQEAESVARRVRNHVPIGTQAPTKTENPGEGGELSVLLPGPPRQGGGPRGRAGGGSWGRDHRRTAGRGAGSERTVRGKSGRVIAVVQAAQSRWIVEETVEQLLAVLVPVGLASLLLAGVGGLLMSRRAVRPVRDSFSRQRAFVAG